MKRTEIKESTTIINPRLGSLNRNNTNYTTIPRYNYTQSPQLTQSSANPSMIQTAAPYMQDSYSSPVPQTARQSNFSQTHQGQTQNIQEDTKNLLSELKITNKSMQDISRNIEKLNELVNKSVECKQKCNNQQADKQKEEVGCCFGSSVKKEKHVENTSMKPTMFQETPQVQPLKAAPPAANQQNTNDIRQSDMNNLATQIVQPSMSSQRISSTTQQSTKISQPRLPPQYQDSYQYQRLSKPVNGHQTPQQHNRQHSSSFVRPSHFSSGISASLRSSQIGNQQTPSQIQSHMQSQMQSQYNSQRASLMPQQQNNQSYLSEVPYSPSDSKQDYKQNQQLQQSHEKHGKLVQNYTETFVKTPNMNYKSLIDQINPQNNTKLIKRDEYSQWDEIAETPTSIRKLLLVSQEAQREAKEAAVMNSNQHRTHIQTFPEQDNINNSSMQYSPYVQQSS